ncbi:anhydro-N-acetylmuramic acid kinase [Flavobacterium sp. NST-5]|uniref:Anhydro-N-acetylmuramic acid kinase n=1 Tax=Flavobacterium ichthyis TaxID=2698827 RepID=A0ABW9Z470_9FLAO|nr:anhydro-N-acetylmuramic acid kinase [Flavobacterium ichthyis]NBL63625.1 anhydro-N-acetylmuramic acid kinase [Flavobacterium ichthyis]
MIEENYNVIGIMSGTSLDGIDLARIIFKISGEKWTFEIHETETISYPSCWLQRLKNAINFNGEELFQLNVEYTAFLGKIINGFIKKNKLENLDAVCSHGHTILHQPQNGLTLQIGNLPQIAKIIQQKVVCDFRVQDVELGGQGAPLVPIGDKILFTDYDFCLNLGGFSNVSFEENQQRIAFDISPVNTVLNFYAEKLGFAYDDEGKIARTGKISNELLSKLNALEFYQKPFPKSLGFEFVKTEILPLMETFPITDEDKLATFVEHIAMQTASALPKKSGKTLVTGGGAYNLFLMEKMQFHLPKMTFEIPIDKMIQYKEALIFALLGVLKLRNENNVLASVTGAKQNHSSGKIFTP